MLMVGTSGCYELEPLHGASPTPGTRVALEVNDSGRVALGGSLGPSIDRVEGRLIEHDKDGYLLSVTSVSLLKGGGVQTWSGEHVAVKPEFVSGVSERRLDKVRTALFAGAITGAVVAIAAQNLLTNGTEDIQQHPDTLVTNRRPRIKHVTLLSIPLSRLSFFGRR